MTLKLTENQLTDLAEKLFEESFASGPYTPKWKDCDSSVRNHWCNAAYDAVEGYNTVIENVDILDIPVKKCCRICEHVDLYRPACNLRGDDIDLECVCSQFQLWKFYEDEDDD